MRSFLRAVIGVVVLVGIAVASEVRTTLALSGLTCAPVSGVLMLMRPPAPY